MILGLKIRTEYSFRIAYGHLDRVLKLAGEGSKMAIVDRHGTWGHVPFRSAAAKAGVSPAYGVELCVVEDADKQERQAENYMGFIARNQEGLLELYDLVSIATRKFYYFPRLDYRDLAKISENIIMLSGPNPNWQRLPNKNPQLYAQLGPSSLPHSIRLAKKLGMKTVATCDNYYPTVSDQEAYQIIIPRAEKNPWPMHILNEDEWSLIWDDKEALTRSKKLLDECAGVELPQGNMVKFEAEQTLGQMCTNAAPGRGVDLSDPIYKDRLERELDLIASKKFEDYFFVIADMLRFAKEHMLVGPARGSSCGSLVCYLLAITEIDPIPYDLLFERFIDINRADLPDIDIDFPDTHRDMVFDYLIDKYGKDCVARLGTVSRYKAKSTIGEVSKALNIPTWEITDLKSAIIERPAGDSRSQFCIADTFSEVSAGRAVLSKYPELRIAEEIEGHARHSGQHAAGVLVTAEPINHFCSVDERNGVAMIDKKDAESLGLLKIDALGLRTLTILQETLETIGWSFEKLLRHPTDDEAAFDVLNRGEYAGIFQFEGYALQRIVSQIPKVDGFEDMAALTAIARPGPMSSGATSTWIKCKSGIMQTQYSHPLIKQVTETTFGVVIYQEQVMQIARLVGKLSWENVSSLRKAISKSMGKEFFDQYWKLFVTGAKENGLTDEEAKAVWENINTMGSYAFNRSHAVSYGMVSYWCCVLKAHFPLEFAASTLRHAKDEEQSIRVLRELSKEGYEYVSVDPVKSEVSWTAKDGKLIGGLTNIKGVGLKKAQRLIAKREGGIAFTTAEKKLMEGKTPFDQLHETEELWGHIKADPQAHKIFVKFLNASEINDSIKGEFAFIGKLKTKVLRDHNEPALVQGRNGNTMTGQTKFVVLTFEDDTETLSGGINRFLYPTLGEKIIEEGKIGDWYVMKGYMQPGFRRMVIKNFRKLAG